MRHLVHPLLLAGLLVSSGCAAPSFIGQTGRVAPKGAFRVGVGAGYQVNTSAAAAVRDGRDLARQLSSRQVSCPDQPADRCWDVADVRPVVDAAFRFALVAPLSVNTQLSGRYGFADGFDVGLRWGPGNKGIDVGWQAFGPHDPAASGWAGAFFAGYGTRDMGALGAVIEDVLQGDASLTDYSLAFVSGRQFGEWAHLYLGGRYVFTHWKAQVLPDLPIIFDGGETQRQLLGTDPSGNLHHVGAVLGGAVGYRRVFVGAELNLVQTSGQARVLFHDVHFSGFGVMPAVYVYGQL